MERRAAAAYHLSAMSHKHAKTLERLFAHPIAMNLHWGDVVKLFEAVGATTEFVHGGRQKFTLQGKDHTFHIPHSGVLDSKDEVMQIRHFLEGCGVTPETVKL